MNSDRNKGLRNWAGENNCFLNVCIQALWQLQPFRNKFSDSTEHVHNSSACIYCALKNIFTQYKTPRDDVIIPSGLRSCLGILYKSEDRFQMGELDDAAEALEAILVCLNKVYIVTGSSESDETHPDSISNRVFGIPIYERLQCLKCSAISKPFGSDLFIYYVYVTELLSGSSRFPNYPFDSLIRQINEEERKSCPSADTPSICSQTKCPVTRYLLQQPEIFTLGLVWVSPDPSSSEISKMLSLISPIIRLSNLFHGVPVQFTYKLRGMVCYYGRHYYCYFYSLTRKMWLVYDDNVVKEVSPDWSSIKEKCVRGKFHPSVLFYERVEKGAPLPCKIPKGKTITKLHTVESTGNTKVNLVTGSRELWKKPPQIHPGASVGTMHRGGQLVFVSQEPILAAIKQPSANVHNHNTYMNFGLENMHNRTTDTNFGLENKHLSANVRKPNSDTGNRSLENKQPPANVHSYNTDMNFGSENKQFSGNVQNINSNINFGLENKQIQFKVDSPKGFDLQPESQIKKENEKDAFDFSYLSLGVSFNANTPTVTTTPLDKSILSDLAYLPVVGQKDNTPSYLNSAPTAKPQAVSYGNIAKLLDSKSNSQKYTPAPKSNGYQTANTSSPRTVQRPSQYSNLHNL